MVDDEKGNNTAEATRKKPGQPDFGTLIDGLCFDELFTGSSHSQNILCGFMPDNIDDIVNRNDSNQSIGIVDNRNGQNVIPFDELCNLFLIGIGSNRENLGCHEPFQWCLGSNNNQLTQRADTDQFTIFIDNVQIERHLNLRMFLLKRCNCFFSGCFFAKSNEFGNHYTAGRIVFVAEEILNFSGLFFAHPFQDGIRLFFWNLSEKICNIICGHGLENVGEFLHLHLFSQVQKNV